MPSKYALSHDGILLITSYRGLVTIAEIRQIATARNADPKVASARFHLIDMEEIVVKVTAEEVRNYADFAQRLPPMPSVERTASINSQDVAYGLGRMLESLLEAKGVPRVTSHFRTFKEAVACLGVDEAAARAFLGQIRQEIDRTLDSTT